MAIKRTIVESEFAPSTDSLWLKENLIRAFINGKWVIIGDTSKELEDIEKLKEQIVTLTAQCSQFQNALNEVTAKVNKDLFEVVTQLPTENISTSRIYCVLSAKEGEENKYTEYAWIKQSDGTFDWEKMGEFVGTPDLSGYMPLKGGIFTGPVSFTNDTMFRSHYAKEVVLLRPMIDYNGKDNLGLLIRNTALRSANMYYSTDGKINNAGSSESFKFELEDGSTVTKNIRVL